VPLQAPLSVVAHIFKRDSFCLVVARQRACVSGDDLGAPRLLREKTVVVGVCSHIDLLKFVLGRQQEAAPPGAHDPRTVLSSSSAATPPWRMDDDAYPIGALPPPPSVAVKPLDPRFMGCQEYIWSAVYHAKTPPASPLASPSTKAAAALLSVVPPLGAEALLAPPAEPQRDGQCPAYIWSFMKNKTPLSSPASSAMPSLQSTPMASPMVFPTSPPAAPAPGDLDAMLPLAQFTVHTK